MRFLIAMLMLLTLAGCTDLRKLNTAEAESMDQWVAAQDADERIEAEHGTLLPPPNGIRGG
jgi:outer membrane biogenesis lipoprotein LolB